jgi:hypothetical protein
MKKLISYKRIYLLTLLPISLLLILLAKVSSYFAEEIYAKHIYKWLSELISLFTGLFPFSIAEVIIIGFPVYLLIAFLRFTIKLIAEREERKDRLMKGILNVFCTLSVIFFMFTILAGLNYYRYSFGVYSDLEIQDSTVEELYSLTESLALKANQIREQVPRTDEEGIFQLSVSHYELAKIANEAYELLSEEYPILDGSYGTAKPVYFSKMLSATEITGLFFPFTMEANVNIDVPDYSIPSTMLHELAHLQGFMREDEANYLAYLAGTKSDNIELQYSSTMMALITSGNALYSQNQDMYFTIRDIYSEGVLKDIRANSRYWQQYEDKVVSTVSNQLNDTYLKANAQEDGVHSYGRMLDLILAQYRKEQNTEQQRASNDE